MTPPGSKTGSIFEGRTLDDAVRKGLEALGLSRAEVMITMLEEGSGGFLGLGARPYRVRIMPRPGGAIPEPDERREGGRRDRGRPERGGRERYGERRGGRDERRGATFSGPARERTRDERGGGRDRGRVGEAPGRMERGAPAASERPGAGGETEALRAGRDAAGDRRGRRGRRGGRDRGREGTEHRPWSEPRPHGAEEPRARRPEAGTAEHSGPALAPGELEAEGKRWAEELLKAMGFEATVTATAEEDRVDVTATVAENEELLTGRKGEVRQALQHVLNRMINRGEGSRYHLQLEINDFWKRREEELKGIAQQLADEAIETQSEAVSEYLNAQERRVIHVTLREDSRVKTYALGSGMIKRLAVAPADFAGGPQTEEE
ncbi:MAG TPA: Jag N-terminal domain-containing protein [Candidatus Eisenbacteria bacterium]|jgi:spoIIIJ-associated protein